MYGAILGDIVGSRFEFHNYKEKDFELFTYDCEFTDDTVMTIAIEKALMESGYKYWNLSKKARYFLREIGRKYPNLSYGANFKGWLLENGRKSTNSYGNGAAMRISGIGWVATDLKQIKRMSRVVTNVSHSHLEAIKGTEAIASCIYLARTKHSKDEIRSYIENSYYPMNFTIQKIRKTYSYNVSCQGSVPQAIECFLESTDFEDALRNAISLGGDSDTIGAMTGCIAEAYYEIPSWMIDKAKEYLPDELIQVEEKFYTYLKLKQ